jgi:hypothetical protein
MQLTPIPFKAKEYGPAYLGRVDKEYVAIQIQIIQSQRVTLKQALEDLSARMMYDAALQQLNVSITAHSQV